MDSDERNAIISAAWESVKGHHGFRQNGAEHVFKAAMRWGIRFGENPAETQASFDRAFPPRITA